MPDNPHKADARAEFLKGATYAEAAEKYSLRPDTVRRWFAEWRRYSVAAPVAVESETKAAAHEMEVASLNERLRQLGAAQSRLPVVSQYTDDTDWSEVWKRAEVENAKQIEKGLHRHNFSLDLPENRPVAFCFMSDQHITAGAKVDLRRMREDAELIAQTDGMYAILGGDAIQNHIKHRSAIISERATPNDQWQMFEFYLSIFAHRIGCMISGNHCDWSVAFAGIDMVQRIAKANRICYAPHEARMDVTVGGQLYKLAVRHMYRFNSSYNQTHSIKQWWTFGEAEYDVGCLCHLHELALEPFFRHGLMRWALRPGSYKIDDAYSSAIGFNRTRPLCPTVILYPGERRITAFHDVRDAAKFLRVERG